MIKLRYMENFKKTTLVVRHTIAAYSCYYIQVTIFIVSKTTLKINNPTKCKINIQQTENDNSKSISVALILYFTIFFFVL